MQLHWHRRDLRVTDNLGIAAETDTPETAGLFVFDPERLANAGPPRAAFLLDSLRELQERYERRDGRLLLARGNPVDVVPAVAAALGATTVTWGRGYSGFAREQDAAVRRELAEIDIGRQAFHDAVHHAPGEITTNDGDPYKVFTYFSRKWHDRPKAEPAAEPDELAAPERPELAEVTWCPSVPALDDLGVDEPEATVPDGGTERARELLGSFCESDIYRYGERRDYPADDCTSRLSPHLTFGTIGIREVYQATQRARERVEGERAESVHEFQDQLAWREFYTQVLWDRPDVVTENFTEYENPIEWREDEEGLQAWKDGRTGYPIVDAGMRQLRQEAYMHNRLRMIVASFLTKDLLIDWREGYDWFIEKLADHNVANNNGGWQWAASTGTDAQPYFRVFNPMTQGERYDADAEYIKEYVEELRGVPADVIHSWHELDAGTRRRHAPEYPEPIVDHSERREQAIAMFERARGE